MHQAVLHGIPGNPATLTAHALSDSDGLPLEINLVCKYGPPMMDVPLTYRFAYHDGDAPHYQLALVDGLEVAQTP